MSRCPANPRNPRLSGDLCQFSSQFAASGQRGLSGEGDVIRDGKQGGGG